MYKLQKFNEQFQHWETLETFKTEFRVLQNAWLHGYQLKVATTEPWRFHGQLFRISFSINKTKKAHI